MKMIIKNGCIVNADKSTMEDIFVAGGIIVEMGKNLQATDSDTTIIDAAGKYIIPGGIDPHVHMQLPTPAGPSSDDFASGSHAALMGGTTTLIDFVTPHHGQSLTEALTVRLAEAAKSVIPAKLHVSPVEWRQGTKDEILECINSRGIRSFKCYMAYKNTVGLQDDELFEVMKVVGKAGALVTLHCEDGDEIERLRNQFAHSDLPAAESHCLSRPPELEARAVAKAITLAQKARCPIYIVHVSAKESLQLIAAAQKSGQQVYAETCPHYLLLDKTKYPGDFNDTAAYVISPPLRTPQDNDALWNAIIQGTIATVGTDHCPFTLEQKKVGRNDFRKIPNGAGGVEHRMALLYTYGVLQKKISMNKLVEVTATNPAKIFGLFPEKGIIAPGSNADLVIWNPETEQRISAKTQHSHCDLNMFEGFTTKGIAETIILEGKIILTDGGKKK